MPFWFLMPQGVSSCGSVVTDQKVLSSNPSSAQAATVGSLRKPLKPSTSQTSQL